MTRIRFFAIGIVLGAALWFVLAAIGVLVGA